MVLLAFVVQAFLVVFLQVVPIRGAQAGVPRNVTLTRYDHSLKFSPDWTTTKANGNEVAVADAIGSELQVDQIVNATAIYFVGLKSGVGSTFAVCLDCQPVRSPTRQFKIIDAYDPAIPDAQSSSPVTLFSMTGLDPTVPHSLRVVNLWDPKFGDFSRIAFDKLIVTTVDPSGNVTGNTSTVPSGGITYSTQQQSNTPLNDASVPFPSNVPNSSPAQAGNSPVPTANKGPASKSNPAQTFNAAPQYPNTSVMPIPGTPHSLDTAQYPNTSVMPISSVSSALVSSASVSSAAATNSAITPNPTTAPTSVNPPISPNQANNGSPTTVTSTQTATAVVPAPPTTETVTIPTVVGNNNGSSVTPSESLSKALLAMMILLLIVFLSCVLFGVVTLYMRARARRRNRVRIEDGVSSMESGAVRITPYVMTSPASASRENFRRNSYTATYYSDGNLRTLPPITIPDTQFDRRSISPVSPNGRPLTPMAEIFQNRSPTMMSSQTHLNPFRDSVAELATSAWLARSPRSRNPD